MAKVKILIDSQNFWDHLAQDIKSAKKNIYLQTLSFEGDQTGQSLLKVLTDTKADDIKIISDQYIKYVINDKFIYSLKNLLDEKLQDEVKATKKLINSFKDNNIKVKILDPPGIPLIKIINCNHKKIVQIDDQISYIGGINFCEHNFLWHDMMLRIEDPAISYFFQTDFLKTWNGEDLDLSQTFENIEIKLTNGNNNKKYFQRVIDLIASAKKSIFIESPYLTFPFYKPLREAKNRGVEINIITPQNNNKKIIGEYIKWEAARSNFNLYHYPEKMTHLKAMLIDNHILITGSSNFDFLSYRIYKETIIIIKDKKIIDDFKEKVIQPDLNKSKKYNEKPNYLVGWTIYLLLKILSKTSYWLVKGL